MLDFDLARIYGVPTKRLKEQVKRNINRFPPDFMFVLTAKEFANLRSQFATSSSEWGGTRYLPTAFTEYGAIMLASVLNSARAIKASIMVVRAFVRLKRLIETNKELAAKIAKIEKKIKEHDVSIHTIVQIIREMMEKPMPARKQIGFTARERLAKYAVDIKKGTYERYS
ncbi:MAG: ORF6N domain-containing protein [Elusimicrobia bacterium]|nr:ORF6N domain-containing protein [Elusimicrobiota bacterium]